MLTVFIFLGEGRAGPGHFGWVAWNTVNRKGPAVMWTIFRMEPQPPVRWWRANSCLPCPPSPRPPRTRRPTPRCRALPTSRSRALPTLRNRTLPITRSTALPTSWCGEGSAQPPHQAPLLGFIDHKRAFVSQSLRGVWCPN